MKKLGTTLLLAIGLLAFSACGKKDNSTAQVYNCGQAGYYNAQCANAYPNGQYPYQNGQYPYQNGYNQQICQAGYVSTQMGCLAQGPCPANYGYSATALNGGPGCVAGTPAGMYSGGYPQQQYPYGYGGYQQYPYGYTGY